MYDGLKISICFDLPVKEDKCRLPEYPVFLKKKLKDAGYHTTLTGFSGSPESFAARMRRSGMDLLWNAFYTFNGLPKNSYLGSMMLDETGLPYSGSKSQALLFCAQSPTMKQILYDSKISVVRRYLLGDPPLTSPEDRWVIRPLWDSNVTEKTVITYAVTTEDIQKAIVLNSLNEEHYAERFVTGRHFVVPVLETEGGMFPLAVGKYTDYESPGLLDDFKDGGRLIVDHYATDNLIVSAMRDIAVKAVDVLGISGYAHVRFVVTSEGRIYVTAVDPVPLIDENSDFVTALDIAGISLKDALKTIISIAMADSVR